MHEKKTGLDSYSLSEFFYITVALTGERKWEELFLCFAVLSKLYKEKERKSSFL